MPTIVSATAEARVDKFCMQVEIRIYLNQIKSNLFAISSVHNITIHKFALRLAGQAGDNFAFMSAHDN